MRSCNTPAVLPANTAKPLQPPGAPDGLPGIVPAELWRVLQRQALLYTGMDSTSVPVEDAGELLASVLFCLQAALAQNSDAHRLPLADWLLAGQRVLQVRVQQGRRLQVKAKGLLLPLRNAVYRDVLRETQTFFTWYDIRLLAHQIPCMIDYPLALPVSETLQGVDYINTYLRQRIWEDGFCRLFPLSQVKNTLCRFAPDYEELPLNLFTPVFCCALGNALRRQEKIDLVPQAGAAGELAGMLAAHSEAEVRPLLVKAAGRLCNALRIWDTARRSYYAAFAQTLVPLIGATTAEGLSRLFVC